MTSYVTIISHLEISPIAPKSLQVAGQKEGQAINSGSGTSFKDSLIFWGDEISGRQFLVGTGPDFSVLLAIGLYTSICQSGPSLMPANGSIIRAYGIHTIQLHIASTKYEWYFTVADVSSPLLGENFL